MRTSSRCVQGKQRFHYYFVTLLGYVNEIKVVKQLPAGGENFRFFCINSSKMDLNEVVRAAGLIYERWTIVGFSGWWHRWILWKSNQGLREIAAGPINCSSSNPTLMQICRWTEVQAWVMTVLFIFSTASLSHLRSMLPESSSCPQPAQQPNHAT